MINGHVRRPPNGPIKIYIYIFTAMEAESEGWDPVKDSFRPRAPPPPPPPHTHTDTRAPPSNSLLIIPRRYFHYGTLCMSIQFISLGNRVATILGKKLPALLAICSFCGCLIVFVCLYLWWWGLDVYLTVSVPEFTYSLCLKWLEFHCFVSAACRILVLCSHVQNAKNGFIQGDKISHIQYDKSNYPKKKSSV